MTQEDPYSKILKNWQQVKIKMAKVKKFYARDPNTEILNHKTTRSWKPGMSNNHDDHGVEVLLSGPIGTRPEDCAVELEKLLRTGKSSRKLHTAAIGSFYMWVTIDKVTDCRVTLNVWAYNEMTEKSFGKYAKYFSPISPMKTQYMWWNWKEEFTYDSKGNYKDIITTNSKNGSSQ